LDPKGPVARMQRDVFDVTLWVTTILWVIVGGALLWAVWRYRERPGDGDKPLPKQTHGSAVVEVGLIIASAVILVFIAVPTLQGIVYMKELTPEDSERAVRIRATGYQWWWQFEYLDEGIITANELHIPVGRPVHVELVSADVNHSFWLPKLAGKTDLIPGQTNDMWFQADEEGTFWGQCAEFCGDSHAFMLFRVHATEEAEFEGWLQQTLKAEPSGQVQVASHQGGSAPASATVQRGQQLFLNHCATCHRVEPTQAGEAPNLHNIASRGTIAAGWMKNNQENLHRWIQQSEDVKPGNLMYNGWQGMEQAALKNEEHQAMLADDNNIAAIIAYLRTLR
jgi:cytochrome c oxidase subunit II